jgi:hypothetical protein
MKRILLILFWILTATLVCSAQTTFIFPQVANGVLGANIWKTSIFLLNPAASGTVSGTITFTQDNCPGGDCTGADPAMAGAPFAISFTDENGTPSSGTIAFSIPAGATKKYLSSGTGAYGGGFAVVSSSGNVSGTAVFSEFTLSNQLVGEAGVPAVPAVPRQAIFVDTTGGFNIGLAYANPGSAGASVTLSLLDSSAALVLSTTAALGPGNHRALFTSQLFPGAGPLVGTVRISGGTTPLSVIALRFDPTFAVFTTLPPVTLTSLINPAIQWLEQRAWLTPLTSIARLLGAFQMRVG